MNPLNAEELAKAASLPEEKIDALKLFVQRWLFRRTHPDPLGDITNLLGDAFMDLIKRSAVESPIFPGQQFDHLLDNFSIAHTPDEETAFHAAIRAYAEAYMRWELKGRTPEAGHAKDSAAAEITKFTGTAQSNLLVSDIDHKAGMAAEAWLMGEGILPPNRGLSRS